MPGLASAAPPLGEVLATGHFSQLGHWAFGPQTVTQVDDLDGPVMFHDDEDAAPRFVEAGEEVSKLGLDMDHGGAITKLKAGSWAEEHDIRVGDQVLSLNGSTSFKRTP